MVARCWHGHSSVTLSRRSSGHSSMNEPSVSMRRNFRQPVPGCEGRDGAIGLQMKRHCFWNGAPADYELAVEAPTRILHVLPVPILQEASPPFPHDEAGHKKQDARRSGWNVQDEEVCGERAEHDGREQRGSNSPRLRHHDQYRLR